MGRICKTFIEFVLQNHRFYRANSADSFIEETKHNLKFLRFLTVDIKYHIEQQQRLKKKNLKFKQQFIYYDNYFEYL